MNARTTTKTALETVHETVHEFQDNPKKQTLMQFQTSINEHIYYHYYDDEIYEHILEKIQHEFYNQTMCNNHKNCPVCNNPSNNIRYHHKREQKRDYSQIQVTIENLVLEIEVLEIFQRNLCMDLCIQVNTWDQHPETNQNPDLHKIIQTNLEDLKKTLQKLTIK